MVADMSSKEVENLWNEYFPKVFGYFYRRLNCREDVEDLTSVVVTSFIDNLSKKEITNPNAYLWRIAHNQLANFIREKSKNPIYVSLEDDEHYQWVDESIEEGRSNSYKQKITQLINCAKMNLKGEEYALIVETFLDEKNSTQIAESQNAKPATIRKRLSRSLQKLRQKCLDIWDNFQNQSQPNYV